MASKRLTYLDANLLIYAADGTSIDTKLRLQKIVGDPGREFIASEFLRLETLPYAIRRKNRREQLYLEGFFGRRVDYWVDDERDLFTPATQLILQHGLQLMDALHLAAAMIYKAEFVTAENPRKPFHKAYAKVAWVPFP
jgi:predicted nucleic acid-binding protein